jgi:hypothetical protein
VFDAQLDGAAERLRAFHVEALRIPAVEDLVSADSIAADADDGTATSAPIAARPTASLRSMAITADNSDIGRLKKLPREPVARLGYGPTASSASASCAPMLEARPPFSAER